MTNQETPMSRQRNPETGDQSMNDEELDKFIDEVGRDYVLQILINAGWGGKTGWPTQKWVWIQAAYQAEKIKDSNASRT